MEKNLSEMKRDEILNEILKLGESSLLNEDKIWAINPDKVVNSYAYIADDDMQTILRAPFTWEHYDNGSFIWEESDLQQFERDLHEGFKDDSLEKLRAALFTIRQSLTLYQQIHSDLRLNLVKTVTNLYSTTLDDITEEVSQRKTL
ncbi:hypothetical protein MZM54_02880 [[Brevibacterium] frigoritolerans]|nr:hypothetical protein [Peribacillus frigoritolerans]